MPKNLQRFYGNSELHFITFSCYRRLPLLRSAHARNVFLQILSDVRDKYSFALVGFVVMPEHVHLLVGEPEKGDPSQAMRSLKQRVSARLRSKRKRAHPSQLALGFSRQARPMAHFWQRRFYDFNVWSRKKKIEKLGYMHMNPVKRGLVSRPGDWIWSSSEFCSGRNTNVIRIDPVE
jgi:putative transposase